MNVERPRSRLVLASVGLFEFIDENGGGPGVRLRKHNRKRVRPQKRLSALEIVFRPQIPKHGGNRAS
jgi:hypothetical protein